MAINPANTTYRVSQETVPGVTDASPTFHDLPYVAGSMPMEQRDTQTDNTRYHKRGSTGSTETNFRVGGGNKVGMRRDDAIELLLQSALSGTWVNDVLTAGEVETSLCIEENMVDVTAGVSTNLLTRYNGIQVSEFSFDLDFTGNCEADVSYVGLSTTVDATPISTAVNKPSSGLPIMKGTQLQNLAINGITGLKGTKLSLKITSARDANGSFGNQSADYIGTQSRTVTGSLTVYRKDFQLEKTLPPGNTQVLKELSFSLIGGTGNTLAFDIPNAEFTVPDRSEDGSKVLATINFTGVVTETPPDIKITRS